MNQKSNDDQIEQADDSDKTKENNIDDEHDNNQPIKLIPSDDTNIVNNDLSAQTDVNMSPNENTSR